MEGGERASKGRTTTATNFNWFRFCYRRPFNKNYTNYVRGLATTTLACRRRETCLLTKGRAKCPVG